MTITEENYLNNIKPLMDKIIKYLKDNKTDQAKKIIVTNLLTQIVKNEFKLDALYNIVKNATPLEKRICAENGINIDLLKKALEN